MKSLFLFLALLFTVVFAVRHYSGKNIQTSSEISESEDGSTKLAESAAPTTNETVNIQPSTNRKTAVVNSQSISNIPSENDLQDPFSKDLIENYRKLGRTEDKVLDLQEKTKYLSGLMFRLGDPRYHAATKKLIEETFEKGQPLYFAYMGDFLFRTGKADEARELYLKLENSESKIPFPWLNAANAYMAANDLKNAQKAFSMALDIANKDSNSTPEGIAYIKYHLGVISQNAVAR